MERRLDMKWLSKGLLWDIRGVIVNSAPRGSTVNLPNIMSHTASPAADK